MKYFSRSAFLNLVTGGQENHPVSLPGNATGNRENIQGTALSPFVGILSQAQVLHLIRRTLFGVTFEDYKFFSGRTLEQCLDILLTQSPNPSPPVNTYNTETFTDPTVPFGQTWVFAPFLNPKGSDDGYRFDNLKAWWVGHLINQDRSLTEKITIFWSNHLAAQMFLMKDSRLAYLYFAQIRTHALGNFKKLVREMTTNPGMLQYLNGNVNTATAPNENYSRELQELFTIGKGPGSHYTESDVKEAARVLTGWETKDSAGGMASLFNPEKHDTGKKQFSAFYNNHVIEGKAGENGASETDELIDMIFMQREVAKYFCRNVYRWFVYYKIDEKIEANIIEPLADTFIKNNFEITPVLRELLGSSHFFEPANMGCQIKNPIDLVIGSCRQMFMAPYPDDIRKQYAEWHEIALRLEHQGMEPGDPPSVAGWPAYYQAPAFTEVWINATTLTERNATTDNLVNLHFDLLMFTSRLSFPSDVNKLIDESCILLSAVPFTTTEIAVMKSILLSGQTQDYYWADAWHEYIEAPHDEIKKSVVLNRLISYYSHLLQRSEYQLT